jgi:hypothetical protein
LVVAPQITKVLISAAQPAFQIGADEGAVDALDDHRLALQLAGFIPDGIAQPIGEKGRLRPRAQMADVKDRRAALPERRQQIGDPRHGVGIVAALAGRFPLIECTLHTDNDQRGSDGRSLAHAGFRIFDFRSNLPRPGHFQNAVFPSLPDKTGQPAFPGSSPSRASADMPNRREGP